MTDTRGMANHARSHDVIDETARKRSAWRKVQPEDFDADGSFAARTAAPTSLPTEAELAACARRDRERLDAIAAGVLRALAIESAAHQASATVALLEQAHTAGFTLAALDERSALGLARLVVRHASALSDVEAAWFSLTLLSLGSSPDVADLICEVAESGNGLLSDGLALGLDLCDLHRTHPKLGARLAPLARPGSSFETRLISLGWLSDGHWPAAIRTQRAALREPYLRLRQAALGGLLHYDTLTAADVLWLIEDAVLHPVPFTAADGVEYVYEDNLTEAIWRVAPHGGAAPLLRILAGDCTPGQDGVRATLGYAWALRALAAGYPAVARPHVDAALAHPYSWRRYEGVLAAGRMPTDDALPRLRRAASDPAPPVAEHARRVWEGLSGRALLVDELEGLPLELLDAPSSDVMRARLLVLRGDALAPRLAMLEALLAAAPDPEALALLAFALGDASVTNSSARPALPVGKGAWTTAIVERFGAAGHRAMSWLDARWPTPPLVAPRVGAHRSIAEADASAYWRDPPDQE